MARTIDFSVFASLFLAGCASLSPPSSVPVVPVQKAEARESARAEAPRAVEPEEIELEDEAPSETASAPQPAMKRPGDLFVQRFSGSFRKTPVVLEEKVIAWEEDVLVTDWTLEEGKSRTTLRVRSRPSEAGAIVSVARLTGETEAPATLADWEAMLEKTAFAADSNDGLVDAGEQTCLVGGRELGCKKVVYKVSVGDAEATMTVLSSDELPGRDVAGEIVSSDGKVVYRAEMLEATRGAPASATASAKP